VVVLAGDGAGWFNNNPLNFKVDSFTAPADYGKWIMFGPGTKPPADVLGIAIDTSQPLKAVFKDMYGGQQGAGTYYKEMYFKAFTVPSASIIQPLALTDYAPAFTAATAVGKVDVGLKGTANIKGKNLFSVPFKVEGVEANVNNVFGSGTGSIWEEGDTILKKKLNSPAYYGAVYKAGAVDKWKDASNASNDPMFTVDPNFGYWAIVRTDKILTVLGKVDVEPTSAKIWGAGQEQRGQTLLGMYYPKQFSLQSSTLVQDGAANGDTIYYKKTALDPAYHAAVLVNGTWKDASNTANNPVLEVATLKLPYSYIFSRKVQADFTWQKTLP